MSLHDFRSVFMPYCLDKQEDGRYVVLNREYKPIGFNVKDFFNYKEYPICSNIAGITPKLAAKLSWSKSEDTKRIYLYNDSCIPTDSAANMKAYLSRLQLLFKLKVSPDVPKGEAKSVPSGTRRAG